MDILNKIKKNITNIFHQHSNLFIGIIKFFNRKKNNLDIYILVEKYGRYTSNEKKQKISVKDVLNEYRTHTNIKNAGDVLVTTKYNGVFYPFLDIDDVETYNFFCNNTNYKYVSVESSTDHHWIFIDKPFKTYNDFINSELYIEWCFFTDDKHSKLYNEDQEFYIRGFYQNYDRMPKIKDVDKHCSDNFKEYIVELKKYFEHTAMELSIIKYKDPDLYKQYVRIKKLERILI
jgi:hypothetical protein